MRLVQPDAANLVLVGIQDDDPGWLLDHLHSDIRKRERHPSGPTLGSRVRSVSAAQLDFAMFLHGFRRTRLQNRIGVVADQSEKAAGGVGCAQPVRDRAGSRQGRLEAGE
jgi:hypothetical protein